MDKKIDIVIITGFLGAGKTTLLNMLVASYSNKNIGLLVNDFGKVPIDGSFIKSSSQDFSSNKIYEIGNGSIFCSCLTADFVLGLQYFIKESPDVLFIETSGMSDPSSMAKLLGEYKLWDAYQIKHVLCVADCTNVLKLRKHLTFVDRQLESSNTVLLNKSDLVSADDKKEIKQILQGVNLDAELAFTNFCDYDFENLQYREFLLDGNATSCNTKSSRPMDMNLPQMDFKKEAFIGFLKSILPLCLRIKGYYILDSEYLYLSNNNGDIEIKVLTEAQYKNTGITIILEGTYLEEVETAWGTFKKEN